MANWREGERVRIVTRPVTEDDRKQNLYFDHMAGLVGTIQNIYADNEIAVKIDIDCMSAVTRKVHKTANDRMREKFISSVGEEQKKSLTTEELNFVANYVLLVRSSDLEKAS